MYLHYLSPEGDAMLMGPPVTSFLRQAESVSRQLGVPVLLHATKKPGCSNAVIEYFQHIQSVGRPLNDTRSDVVKGKGKGKAFYQSDYPPVPVVDIRPSTSHDASCVQSPITSLETTVDLPTGTPTDETRILVIGDRVMTDVVLANRINRHRANTGSRKVRAIAVLTTTIWEMEGLGSRIMRVIETFATRRVEAFDLRRRGVDDAAEYSDCLLEAAKPPAVVPPFSPPTRQTSRSRIPLKSRPLYSLVLGALSSILAWVTYPVRRLIFARYGRYADSIHTFISEARQNQYGFNAPLKYREISQARGLYRSWINRAILPRKG